MPSPSSDSSVGELTSAAMRALRNASVSSMPVTSGVAGSEGVSVMGERSEGARELYRFAPGDTGAQPICRRMVSGRGVSLMIPTTLLSGMPMVLVPFTARITGSRRSRGTFLPGPTMVMSSSGTFSRYTTSTFSSFSVRHCLRLFILMPILPGPNITSNTRYAACMGLVESQ